MFIFLTSVLCIMVSKCLVINLDIFPVAVCRKACLVSSLICNAFIYSSVGVIFSLQPVLHDWHNKGRGICCSVCGMVHLKEPLLPIKKSSLYSVGSGFLLSLSSLLSDAI